MINSYYCVQYGEGVALMLSASFTSIRHMSPCCLSVQVGPPGTPYESSTSFTNPLLNPAVPQFDRNESYRADRWLARQLKKIEAWVAKHPGELLE